MQFLPISDSPALNAKGLLCAGDPPTDTPFYDGRPPGGVTLPLCGVMLQESRLPSTGMQYTTRLYSSNLGLAIRPRDDGAHSAEGGDLEEQGSKWNRVLQVCLCGR